MAHLTRSACLAAALATLPAPTDAAGAETGIQAEFRAWIVGCDNVRSCRAIGFPAEPGNGSALIVDRAGEGDARPVLRLRLERPEDSAGPLEGGIELAADGAAIGRLEVGRSLRVEAFDAERRAGDIDDPAIEAALLKALRGGREIVARRPGGATLATISLDGAAAALLFMDDRQRRIGTKGALMRPGERPDGTVPAPPPLPEEGATPAAGRRPLPKTLPAEVRRLIEEDRRRDDCDPGAAGGGPPAVHRLGTNTLLYGLPCWQGAYQGSTAYFLYREADPPRAERIRLPRPPVRPAPDRNRSAALPGHTVTGDGYSGELGQMFEFAKGRGIGDCGTVARWRWTGSAFAPIHYGTMPVCAGLDHDDWLTLHRSRERPERP